MRTVISLAVALLLAAVPAAADSRGFPAWTYDAYRVAMRHAGLMPRPWPAGIEFFGCAFEHARKLGYERRAPRTTAEDEADEAVDACRKEAAALAGTVPAREAADIIKATLSVMPVVTRIARRPAPHLFECLDPTTLACLRAELAADAERRAVEP
jgi:hypothetical protein